MLSSTHITSDHKNRTLKGIVTLAILAACFALMLAGCGASPGAEEGTGTTSMDEHKTGSMDLGYATQFHVDYYDDGVSVVTIEDGLSYLLVPDADDLPEWLENQTREEEAAEGFTIIETPVTSVYMAASSGMDLINAAGGMDSVVMTSTQAKDWSFPEIRELVESGKIRYIGKYRAPDYEALVEADTGLAVESTMIYHSPDVKEQIESLGIPVLVERSSYESDPLGRLEWIRLYGLLLGRESEADAFFDEAVGKVSGIDTDSIEEGPDVAFFSVNSGGSVVVRKPGDYVTRMIEMAGGRYALRDIADEEDNALSTMNMQMEAFYDMASESDILIYNSAIESDLTEISDLTTLSPQFEDFKAVRTGDVWCTNKSVFQKVTGAADMIVEMNRIFMGEADDDMEYFHKLK